MELGVLFRAGIQHELHDLLAGVGDGEGAHGRAHPVELPAVAQQLFDCLQEGVRVTMTTAPRTNVLIRGMPQSLLGMGRYSVSNTMSGADLVALLDQNIG